MIDESSLERLTLRRKSIGQILVGTLFLGPNYNLPPRTEIAIEGIENIPTDRTVIFAMNHTDRYNYWPFQYKLWRLKRFPYTTTWVKAKYYGNKLLAWFFNRCNNIPLPSKGYLIFQDALHVLQRKLDNDEYRLLRDLLDGRLSISEALDKASSDIRRILTEARRDFRPDRESWTAYMSRWNRRIMGLVEKRTLEALREKLNNLIVFPQGTRSKRLQPGHPGLAQFALRHRCTIVPVGCMGSENVYPGGSPIAGGGRILYRVGAPLEPDGALAEFAIDEPYAPFTEEAAPFADIFRRATERITMAINDLLDEPYKLALDGIDQRAKAEQLI